MKTRPTLGRAGGNIELLSERKLTIAPARSPHNSASVPTDQPSWNVTTVEPYVDRLLLRLCPSKARPHRRANELDPEPPLDSNQLAQLEDLSRRIPEAGKSKAKLNRRRKGRVRRQWPWELNLYQPTPAALELLAWFLRHWPYVISEVEIAIDYVVARPREAISLRNHLATHLIMPRVRTQGCFVVTEGGKKRPFPGDDNPTIYSNAKRQSKRPVGHRQRLYVLRPLDSLKKRGDTCWAVHLEWILSTPHACRSVEIRSLLDLARFDHTEFWQEHLRLTRLDLDRLARGYERCCGKRINGGRLYRILAAHGRDDTTEIEVVDCGTSEPVVRHAVHGARRFGYRWGPGAVKRRARDCVAWPKIVRDALIALPIDQFLPTSRVFMNRNNQALVTPILSIKCASLREREREAVADVLGLGGPPRRGRPAYDSLRTVDAIIYREKARIPWRKLPREFGGWNAVWAQFQRWRRSGIWKKIQAASLPQIGFE